MANETVTYLQLFSAAVRSEVRINDIPVARAQANEQRTSSIPVQQYLMPGSNTITLYATPEEMAFRDTDTLHLRVAEFEADAWIKMDGGKGLTQIHPVLGPQTKAPLRRETTFESNQGQPWAWVQAPQLELSAHRDLLIQYVAHLAALFAARDIEGLLPHFMQRMTEDAQAYPSVPLELRIMDFRTIFDGITPNNWKPIPFDPARLVMRGAANGRLIELQDPEGHPFLSSLPHNADVLHKDPHFREIKVMVGIWQGRFAVLA
ncbi:MAG: hypothetical protein K9K67_14945 [Bacteriovoracaceae bacterium]|nr:hypothetical protein [Bacteriovoracaceae bacterium]